MRRAIESGRLEKSVVVVDGDPKIADADLADREWEANTRAGSADDQAPAPAPPRARRRRRERVVDDDQDDDEDVESGGLSYNEARRRREVELWRQTRVKRLQDELELAVRERELVPVDEARADVVARFSVVRTKMLGLPTRIKQRMPHIAAEDIRQIDDLVREGLEALAIDEPAETEADDDADE